MFLYGASFLGLQPGICHDACYVLCCLVSCVLPISKGSNVVGGLKPVHSDIVVAYSVSCVVDDYAVGRVDFEGLGNELFVAESVLVADDFHLRCVYLLESWEYVFQDAGFCGYEDYVRPVLC